MRALFERLEKVWKHANVTIQRKLAVYQACVAVQVMYSLESVWLLQTDRSRLDAFPLPVITAHLASSTSVRVQGQQQRHPGENGANHIDQDIDGTLETRHKNTGFVGRFIFETLGLQYHRRAY